MSGSVAKETRRDVRKAFGDQAALTLERQGQHLTGLGTLLHVETQRHDELEKRIDVLARDLKSAHTHIEAVATELNTFKEKKFYARLRWWLRGR